MKVFLRKHRSVALAIVFVVMSLMISTLLTQQFLWYVTVGNTANALGELEAEQSFRWGDYVYYRIDTSEGAGFTFTGELMDGVELWAYPSVSRSLFHLHYFPEQTKAKYYVKSFNEEMRRLVSKLQPPPSAIKSRTQELKSEDSKRRQKAARILGQMGDKAREAIPELIKSTRDEMPEVRATAAWALAHIGPSEHNDEVIAVLEELRKTPNAKMQEVATRALNTLTQKIQTTLPKADQH